MPLGIWTVFQGYAPPARWPSAQKLVRVGAWGPVVLVGALWMVQPWDWMATTVGLKTEEKK